MEKSENASLNDKTSDMISLAIVSCWGRSRIHKCLGVLCLLAERERHMYRQMKVTRLNVTVSASSREGDAVTAEG